MSKRSSAAAGHTRESAAKVPIGSWSREQQRVVSEIADLARHAERLARLFAGAAVGERPFELLPADLDLFRGTAAQIAAIEQSGRLVPVGQLPELNSDVTCLVLTQFVGAGHAFKNARRVSRRWCTIINSLVEHVVPGRHAAAMDTFPNAHRITIALADFPRWAEYGRPFVERVTARHGARAVVTLGLENDTVTKKSDVGQSDKAARTLAFHANGATVIARNNISGWCYVAPNTTIAGAYIANYDIMWREMPGATLPPRFIVCGSMSSVDVYSLLRHCRVFLVPREYSIIRMNARAPMPRLLSPTQEIHLEVVNPTKTQQGAPLESIAKAIYAVDWPDKLPALHLYLQNALRTPTTLPKPLVDMVEMLAAQAVLGDGRVPIIYAHMFTNASAKSRFTQITKRGITVTVRVTYDVRDALEALREA